LLFPSSVGPRRPVASFPHISEFNSCQEDGEAWWDSSPSGVRDQPHDAAVVTVAASAQREFGHRLDIPQVLGAPPDEKRHQPQPFLLCRTTMQFYREAIQIAGMRGLADVGRPVRSVPPTDDQRTGAKRPLSPAMRTLLRLPRHLYTYNVGWVLGRRFLQLTHTGRSSRWRHATVLELVGHTATGELVVVSGLGPHADWLRNLRAGGPAQITVGRRTVPVAYRLLEIDEAAAALADYEHRNRLLAPLTRRLLSMLLGWRYHATPAHRPRAVAQLPMVALLPTAFVVSVNINVNINRCRGQANELRDRLARRARRAPRTGRTRRPRRRHRGRALACQRRHRPPRLGRGPAHLRHSPKARTRRAVTATLSLSPSLPAVTAARSPDCLRRDQRSSTW
jgi:deazaflavin-dependent oxidoreductase (nitroreductase family)